MPRLSVKEAAARRAKLERALLTMTTAAAAAHVGVSVRFAQHVNQPHIAAARARYEAEQAGARYVAEARERQRQVRAELIARVLDAYRVHTSKEVARMFNISQHTVRAWAADAKAGRTNHHARIEN